MRDIECIVQEKDVDPEYDLDQICKKVDKSLFRIKASSNLNFKILDVLYATEDAFEVSEEAAFDEDEPDEY